MTLNRQVVVAPETTKVCPNCGSDKLALIGTHNIKMCADCPTNIDWKREPGEPDTYGGAVEE